MLYIQSENKKNLACHFVSRMEPVCVMAMWCSDGRRPASHRAAVCLRGSLCPACGGWWWLSGCLDGLDKDIKGKQKAALWRGHRRGQTSLFSIQVGVSVQGYLSCREIGGGVGLAVKLTQICLTYNMCDCIFYFLLFSYWFYLWGWLSMTVMFLGFFIKKKKKSI